MKHLRQPNGWSCVATSFAMVLDTSVEEIFEYTGHDGSAIVFPGLNDPHCRRGHTVYEMIQFALHCGIGVIPMSTKYAHTSLISGQEIVVDVAPEIIEDLYAQEHMVMLGTVPSGTGHAISWNSETQVFLDPNGSTYKRQDSQFNVELMLLCLPLKWPPRFSLKQNSG